MGCALLSSSPAVIVSRRAWPLSAGLFDIQLRWQMDLFAPFGLVVYYFGFISLPRTSRVLHLLIVLKTSNVFSTLSSKKRGTSECSGNTQTELLYHPVCQNSISLFEHVDIKYNFYSLHFFRSSRSEHFFFLIMIKNFFRSKKFLFCKNRFT